MQAWSPAGQVLHRAAHCGVAGGMYSGSTTGAGVIEGGVSERSSRSTRCGAPGAAEPPPHTSTLSRAAWDRVTCTVKGRLRLGLRQSLFHHTTSRESEEQATGCFILSPCRHIGKDFQRC